MINDLIGTNAVNPKKTPAIRKFKDFILAAFAFPLALNVGVSFWTLMAIDRELVLPKVLDAIFPRLTTVHIDKRYCSLINVVFITFVTVGSTM